MRQAGSKGSGRILAPSATRDVALGQRASLGLGTTHVPSGRVLQRPDASASVQRLGDTEPPASAARGHRWLCPVVGDGSPSTPGSQENCGEPSRPGACPPRPPSPRGRGRKDRISRRESMRVTGRVTERGSRRVLKFGVSQTPGCRRSREHSLGHECGAVGGGDASQRVPCPGRCVPSPRGGRWVCPGEWRRGVCPAPRRVAPTSLCFSGRREGPLGKHACSKDRRGNGR